MLTWTASPEHISSEYMRFIFMVVRVNMNPLGIRENSMGDDGMTITLLKCTGRPIEWECLPVYQPTDEPTKKEQRKYTTPTIGLVGFWFRSQNFVVVPTKKKMAIRISVWLWKSSLKERNTQYGYNISLLVLFGAIATHKQTTTKIVVVGACRCWWTINKCK